MPVIEKRKFPRVVALAAVRSLLPELEPACERLIVAGSLRRGKEQVSDAEILFIPKIAREKDGLFEERQVSLAALALERLLQHGIIAKRRNKKGCEVWGEQNRLAVHLATQVPIDFFIASHENWWNLLVCRTGPKENNIAICNAARARGMKWCPYGAGFKKGLGMVLVNSEADVYRIAGLPYKEPQYR